MTGAGWHTLGLGDLEHDLPGAQSRRIHRGDGAPQAERGIIDGGWREIDEDRFPDPVPRRAIDCREPRREVEWKEEVRIMRRGQQLVRIDEQRGIVGVVASHQALVPIDVVRCGSRDDRLEVRHEAPLMEQVTEPALARAFEQRAHRARREVVSM